MSLEDALLYISSATPNNLDRIQETLNARRTALRSMHRSLAKDALDVGDAVRLGDTLSPKYMRGLTGKIVGRVAKGFSVVLDEESAMVANAKGRRYWGGSIGVPAECLTKVD